MKQGQASHNGVASTKVEPKSQGVNPGAVSRIGHEVGPFTSPKQMYEGRGIHAPMVSQTSHPAGSQGKHK